MTAEEEKAIKIAKQALEINDVQVSAIGEFIRVLSTAQNDPGHESVETVKAATERMKKVGIPIEALAHSQDGAKADLEYSDEKFLDKMKAFGIQAGKELVEQALIMWYTLHDPITPTQSKLIIAGALAYWIFPVDMIPDVLPAVGFTDDFSAIATAIASIAMNITPEVRVKAKQQTEALFGGQTVLELRAIDVS